MEEVKTAPRVRIWIISYLTLDQEGLVQGYRVKVRGKNVSEALYTFEAYQAGAPHFVTEIAIAAVEAITEDGPQLDPLADPLDWPWYMHGVVQCMECRRRFGIVEDDEDSEETN